MSTSTRRAPLASIPQVANSPHRPVNTSGCKRPRSIANVPQQENDPPPKRHMADRQTANANPTTPPRHIHVQEDRVLDRRNGAGNDSFQKKLVAARDKETTRTQAVEDHPTKDQDSIRQWQRHTRKVFPTFSFYFESMPEDARARFAKQATFLGAREEKFFSKTVTHIVTSRQIPSEIGASKSSDSNNSGTIEQNDVPQTINPSLLNKNNIPRNAAQVAPGLNTKRDVSGNVDLLIRARQMGMKIWSIDKFQRILISIFNEGSAPTHPNRNQPAASQSTRLQKEDLTQVLRKEKAGATSERELLALFRDQITFKGPFLYVHDMDERTRPVMIREYTKVARRQDGDWPQFRSTAIGKCPFVEEPLTKREQRELIEEERIRHRRLEQQRLIEAQQVAQAQAVVSTKQANMEPPCRRSPRRPLQEKVNLLEQHAPANVHTTSSVQLPMKAERQSSLSSVPAFTAANGARPPRMLQFGGEPAASGIVRSNMTSAIQSQMMSSAAAAPGAKAGTSKEVHELKRKVLERGYTGSLSNGSIPSSHRMTDIAGALKDARAPAPQRVAKTRAQERLGGVQEEREASLEATAAEHGARQVTRKKKPAKRDPKPGYCENCREKYEDFETHVVSKKHRKFAHDPSNWTELDQLLAILQEP